MKEITKQLQKLFIPWYRWQRPYYSNRCCNLQSTLCRPQQSDLRPHMNDQTLRKINHAIFMSNFTQNKKVRCGFTLYAVVIYYSGSSTFLTPGSSSARRTQATIAVNFINTRGSECTRWRLALIDVCGVRCACYNTILIQNHLYLGATEYRAKKHQQLTDATVGPRESTGTLTPVPVITVHTRAAVIAVQTWGV